MIANEMIQIPGWLFLCLVLMNPLCMWAGAMVYQAGRDSVKKEDLK